MQTIYIDVLICVNLFVNYFLLLTVKKFLSLHKSRLRLLLGAFTGAAESLVILLPKMNFIVAAAVNLVFAVSVAAVAFLPLDVHNMLKAVAFFYLCNFGYAGIMLAVWFFIAPSAVIIKNGAVYFDISPLAVAVLTLLSYFTVNLVYKITGKKEPEEIYCTAELFFCGKQVKMKVKIDTGCALREPFSGFPAIVVSREAVKISPESFPSYRIIPFSVIGAEGTMGAFRPEKIELSVKARKIVNDKFYAAVCEDLIDGGRCAALINPEIISEGREENESNKKLEKNNSSFYKKNILRKDLLHKRS